MEDEQLHEGVRDLHDRVTRLSDSLQADRVARDLSERLAGAADETAERTRSRLHHVAVVLALGLLLWTPLTAYGAVWLHEKVRNNCYPLAAYGQPAAPPPAEEEWYCGLFPGTDHPMPPGR